MDTASNVIEMDTTSSNITEVAEVQLDMTVSGEPEEARPKTPDSYLELLIKAYESGPDAKEPSATLSSFLKDLSRSLSPIPEHVGSSVDYEHPEDFSESSKLDAQPIIIWKEPEPTCDLTTHKSAPGLVITDNARSEDAKEKIILHVDTQNLSWSIEGTDPFSEEEWKALFTPLSSPHSDLQEIHCQNPLVLTAEPKSDEVPEDGGNALAESWSFTHVASEREQKEAEVTHPNLNHLGKPVLGLEDFDPKFLQRLKERNERYIDLKIHPEHDQGSQSDIPDDVARSIKSIVEKMTENISSSELANGGPRSLMRVTDYQNASYSKNDDRGFTLQQERLYSPPASVFHGSEGAESFEYPFKTDTSHFISSIIRGYNILHEVGHIY